MDPKSNGKLSLTQYIREGPDAAGVWASFDITTPEGKRLAFNATTASDYKAADTIDQDFSLAGVLIHRVTMTDSQTGEDRPCFRTVLLDEENSSVGCISDGVTRALVNLEALYGPPPWNPPLVIRIKQHTGKGPNRYYTLELV